MIEKHSADLLLRWYLDAGVDECIVDQALDRFAAPPPLAEVKPVFVPSPTTSHPPVIRPMASALPVPATSASSVPATSHGTSAHLAADCRTLEQLRRCMEQFDDLPLKRTARSTVFADGNPQAALMVIGEAPGQDEDRQGLPFVGKSGKLLDRMLASIGFSRQDVYISNVVPWRPFENRKPSSDEIAACLPFIIRHIELVDPKCLLLLGGASASALLARGDVISRLRGQWFEFSSPGLPRPIPALASFHPAYLLRTPAAKREAWRDLLMLQRKMRAITLP